MSKNEGGLDRTLRIVLGLGLMAAAATGAIGAWGYMGVVPVITGSLGWCPLYTLLGINTCPMQQK